MEYKVKSICLFILLFITGFPQFGTCRNLHLIDQLPNGFKIYRSGVPDEDDLLEYAKRGIREIAVLSGDADTHELKYKKLVPRLKVVYNEDQDGNESLNASFLQWFDSWVENARAKGKIIAIRCYCGCHRTGRLAAYYQMKYMQMPVDDAIEIMMKLGKGMHMHPYLSEQVKSLEDYILNRPCSQEPEYCVINDLPVNTGKTSETPSTKKSPGRKETRK